MLKFRLILIFILLFTCIARAESKRIYSCVFEKPFIFGASISAGFGGVQDGMRGTVAAKMGLTYRGSNADPVTKLALKYFPEPFITNVSEMVNSMPNQGYGHRQFARYLIEAQRDHTKMKVLKESTLLASVDGFYWPAGDKMCNEAIRGLQYIIRFARQNNKPLLLATVPEEEEDKVDILLRNVGWYPPEKNCLEEINNFVKTSCHTTDQCYYVDMHAVVKELNSTGISFEDQLRNISSLRFDGVHLSPRGVRYIMSLIEQTMQANPPSSCHGE